MNRCRSFLHAVDIVPELATVVDGRHVIPRAQRVQALPIDQRLLGIAAVHVTVEIPSAVDDADLEQHAVVAAVLLQMKPALRRFPSVRTEDRLPRERRRSRERVDVDEDRSVCAIEFDRLADRRVDNSRMSQNGRLVAADSIESIEGPQFRFWGRGEGSPD